ncbi:MAG: nucleotidyltransferase [Acidocella sp. 20-57-95]|nr:MAG: nucleotidyltransferase [Acidocella sp. 20-57-95]OYV61378.1 MAG: nucleotidyltransferase [Acidocella sp. 21-58-7]HQT65423.1 nucleotidyltransferase substrate binding protein [Acidocella sp.]
MKLDISSLTHAIQRLSEGLARYQRDITDEQIRDGLIQRFEFTYELSHKMLKRYLETAVASPHEVNDMAFADLIRTGNEYGLLLGDWPKWRRYRDMRSQTSHTYDAAKALQVVAMIPEFLAEAEFLHAQLQKRLAA